MVMVGLPVVPGAGVRPGLREIDKPHLLLPLGGLSPSGLYRFAARDERQSTRPPRGNHRAGVARAVKERAGVWVKFRLGLGCGWRLPGMGLVCVSRLRFGFRVLPSFFRNFFGARPLALGVFSNNSRGSFCGEAGVARRPPGGFAG